MEGNQQERNVNRDDFANLEWLKPKEAAAYLRVGTNTLYEAIKQDQVPGVLRVGNRITINKQKLIDAATDGTGSREARDV